MKASIKKLLTLGTTLRMIRTSPRKIATWLPETREALETFRATLTDSELATVTESPQKGITPEGINMTQYIFETTTPRESLALPRKIIKVQTNAIQFEGKSWLYFDAPAANSEHTPNGFIVWDSTEMDSIT